MSKNTDTIVQARQALIDSFALIDGASDALLTDARILFMPDDALLDILNRLEAHANMLDTISKKLTPEEWEFIKNK